MRICGIEIKGNDANICLLSYADGLCDLPDCRARRFTLPKINTGENIRDFQFAFNKLIEDYKIDQAVIIERPMKGKFAGSASGFKMEAAIQLSDAVEAVLISPVELKAIIKAFPIPIQFSETGLKMFQEMAFKSAFAIINKEQYLLIQDKIDT